MSDVKSITEDESELVEKADKAAEIQQKMVQLREEKKQMIEENSEKQSNERKSSNRVRYLKGTVKSLEEDGFGHIIINIEYITNGESKSENFRLSMPQDPDDYSVENKYIRLRKTVGVDDKNSLMARDVPLKLYSNGDVELDIPENPTYTSILRKKTERKILSSSTYEYFTEKISSDSIVTPIGTVSGILMILFSIVILSNGYTEIGGRFLVDVLMSFFFVGFILTMAPIFEHEVRDDVRISSSVVLILGSLISYLVAFGHIPVVWVSSEYTLLENLLTLLQYGTAIGLLSNTFFLIAYSDTEKIKSTVSGKLSNAKNWVRKKQGIEFVR